MGQKILVQPSEVWDEYSNHSHNFREYLYEIASNDDYGVKVYLSEGTSRIANISVQADDTEVYSENVVNGDDCEKTVTKIYDRYLTPKVIEILSDMDEEDGVQVNKEYAVTEREEELDTLVYEFVMGVLGGDAYFDEKTCDVNNMFEDIKDHFLEYMARKYNLQIFRPMFLEDEDGNESFENYPYECMEFEDDDNPVYKK